MLGITPPALEFETTEQQLVKLENESPSHAVTFKVEANCSARFKVHPTVGVVPPQGREVVTIKLRENEQVQPDDRFLLRMARYNDGDFTSVKEFWAEAKRSPGVISHEKVILRVQSSSSTSSDAPFEQEASTAQIMQSFMVRADLDESRDAPVREPSKPAPSAVAGEENDDDDDEQIAAMIFAAEKSRQLSLPEDEAQALMAVAETCNRRGEHALAAAWMEEANRAFGLGADRSQAALNEALRAGDVDEFAFLCAKQEVTKARAIARRGNGSSGRREDVAPPSSPPPPPPPGNPPPSRPTTLSSKRYAAPTESSLAHLRGSVHPEPSETTERPSPVPRPRTGPFVNKPAPPGGIRRSIGPSSPASIGSPQTKRRAAGAAWNGSSAVEYVLEVVVGNELWPSGREFPQKSQRVVLPRTDMTVREMKDLAKRAFRLHGGEHEEEEIDLFIVGIRLSDHWRAADFGLRPGVTRTEMRPKPQKVSSHVASATAATAAVASVPHPPEPSVHLARTDSAASASMRIEQLAQYESRILELEEENSRLKSDLELRTRDLDNVSARMLSLTREKDRAEEERSALATKLAAVMSSGAVASPGRRNSAPLPPGSPGPGARSPKSSIGSRPFSVNAFCIVAAPAYLLPEGEEDEDYYAGGEEEGPNLEGDQGDVVLDGHSFHFDAATALSAIAPPIVSDRILSMLPGDLFDSVLEGASRTIVILGETSAGKSAVMEGFDPLSTNLSPRGSDLGAAKEFNVSPRAAKRTGLIEAVAVHLYKSIAAVTAESAIMGGDLAVYTVEISGFQTFRDGRVIDFLSQPDKEEALEECVKIPVPVLSDFERVLKRMLKKKNVSMNRTSVPSRGDPSDPDSCVVFTFEITRRGENNSLAKSRLRLIETCGTELGGVSKNPLVGRIVEGEASVLAVLHPSIMHSSKSVEVCTMALEMARRYEAASGAMGASILASSSKQRPSTPDAY